MNSDSVEFLAKQAEQVLAFRRALTKESDRGCALFAAAYLDKALSDFLYVHLVGTKKIEKDLFEGTAPLATFSARTKMAFYIGGISAEAKSDLDLIRKIRNSFAHDVAELSFESRPIADQCRSLAFTYHPKNESPRNHFTAATAALLGKLLGATLTTMPLKQKADDRPTEQEKEQFRKALGDFVDEIVKDRDGAMGDA